MVALAFVFAVFHREKFCVEILKVCKWNCKGFLRTSVQCQVNLVQSRTSSIILVISGFRIFPSGGDRGGGLL